MKISTFKSDQSLVLEETQERYSLESIIALLTKSHLVYFSLIPSLNGVFFKTFSLIVNSPQTKIELALAAFDSFISSQRKQKTEEKRKEQLRADQRKLDQEYLDYIHNYEELLLKFFPCLYL